jgi:hypothetical protein
VTVPRFGEPALSAIEEEFAKATALASRRAEVKDPAVDSGSKPMDTTPTSPASTASSPSNALDTAQISPRPAAETEYQAFDTTPETDYHTLRHGPQTPEAKLSLVESIIGYTFQSPALGLEALNPNPEPLLIQHNFLHYNIPHNTRLAVLGDGILDTALAAYWYETDKNKWTYTEWRTYLLSNHGLDELGRELGIHRCFLVWPEGNCRSKCVASAVEAIVGAVFQDAGGAGSETGWRTVNEVCMRLVLWKARELEERGGTIGRWLS